jgi:hypothetical protein
MHFRDLNLREARTTMPIRKNPKIIKRIKAASDCWSRNDFHALMKHYRRDAVLSSPFVRHAPDEFEYAWIQGHKAISDHLSTIRKLFPRMKKVGMLYGTNFLVVLMSDGEEFLSMQIEPDDSGRARRNIICYSGALEALPNLIVSEPANSRSGCQARRRPAHADASMPGETSTRPS